MTAMIGQGMGLSAVLAWAAILLVSGFVLGVAYGVYQGQALLQPRLTAYARDVIACRAAVTRWQLAAEYILSQEGNNLCWRDFYVKLGECLPDGHPLKDLAKLRSIPPMPIMMRNCASFCRSIGAAAPYKAFTPGLVPHFGELRVTVVFAVGDAPFNIRDRNAHARTAFVASDLPITVNNVQLLTHSLVDECLEQLQHHG